MKTRTLEFYHWDSGIRYFVNLNYVSIDEANLLHDFMDKAFRNRDWQIAFEEDCMVSYHKRGARWIGVLKLSGLTS